MTPSRPKDTWAAIERLFDRASELAPADREAFLAGCGESPEVVAEVRKLLASDELATQEGFLAPVGTRKGESTERRAGPYVLLDQLGRGGMGVVYRAERSDGQFADQVAVKILRRELDQPTQRQRFLAERQILAGLRHPNIAYLLDGGVTEEGSPYLVMELVRGESIDQFCAQQQLTVAQRLRLFTQVVSAVEHAHRNLVVHRDLKPSNVLVEAGDEDGEPRVKLLDFGIAKLTEEGEEALTRTGHLVMTPLYASPEQVLGETVTTASDVYQLGVLLYELLTGARPYASRTSSAVELARAILEDDPEAPSRAASRVRAASSSVTPVETRPLASINEPATSLAPHRSMADALEDGAPESVAPDCVAPDYFELRRTQRADLDAMMLTALAKDTSRRYGSARELREDIERYLDSRPLVARGDSQFYKLGKWVRRHRAASVAIVTSALLIVSILASGVLAIGQATRLEAERNRAHSEAQQASAVADFLAQIFASADPEQHQGEELTARNLLALGNRRIDELQAPAARLRLLGILGRAYSNLGDYEEASKLCTRRLEEARQMRAPETLAEALIELADVERFAGRPQHAAQLLAEAEPLCESEGNPSRLAYFYDTLGDVERDLGNWPEAVELFRQARDLWQQIGEVRRSVDPAMALGEVLHFLNRFEEAEAIQRQALATFEELGEEHTIEALDARHNLAMAISAQGRHAEAETSLLAALEGFRTIYGGDHPNIAAATANLAVVVSYAGRPADAEALLLEALAARRRMFPEDHPEIASSLHNLGSVLMTTRPDDAEAYLHQALDLRRATLGSDHVLVAGTLTSLADTLWLQERLEESLPMRREALRILEAQLPAGNADLEYALKALTRTLERLGTAPTETTTP